MGDAPIPESLPRLLARRQANRGVVTRIFAAIETFRDDEDLENKFKVPLIEAQLATLDAKLADLDEIDHRIQNLTADDALENVISENERYLLQQQILKAEVVVYCDDIRPSPPPSVEDSASVSSRSEYASILSARAPTRYSKITVRAQGTKEWTLNDLRASLKTEIDIMETSQLPSHQRKDESSGSSNTYTAMTSNASSVQTKSCPFCTEGHKPVDCTKHSSSEDRFTSAQKQKLCFNCISSSHRSKGTCNKCASAKRNTTLLYILISDMVVQNRKEALLLLLLVVLLLKLTPLLSLEAPLPEKRRNKKMSHLMW